MGATLNAALVVMGDRLGYYQALADLGPRTPAELAEWTSTDEHYTREWLNAQAAGGFVEYDAGTGRFTLPPEQAVAMTDPSSPRTCPGFFQIALGTVQHTTQTIEAARSGAGIGWHEHTSDVHVGCERFFRPSYNANLLTSWLPALDGVVEKLQRGATVADIGCGHGSSTILMAEAFPRSTLRRLGLPPGVDRDGPAAGGGGRCRRSGDLRGRAGQRVQRVRLRPGDDLRRPARHGRSGRRGPARAASRWPPTAPGCWSSRWPATTSRTTSTRSAARTTASPRCSVHRRRCRSRSASALGTQAGPARIQDVTTAAGFTRFRTVAQTPFNLVFEVRP